MTSKGEMDSETAQIIKDVLSSAGITVQQAHRFLRREAEVKEALRIVKDVLRDRGLGTDALQTLGTEAEHAHNIPHVPRGKGLGMDALQSLGPSTQLAPSVNISLVQHVGTSQNHSFAAHDHTLSAYDHAQVPHNRAQAARDRNTVTMTNGSQPNERLRSTPVRTDRPFARSANASGMQHGAGNSAVWGNLLQPEAASSSILDSVFPSHQREGDADTLPSKRPRLKGTRIAHEPLGPGRFLEVGRDFGQDPEPKVMAFQTSRRILAGRRRVLFKRIYACDTNEFLRTYVR